MRLVLAVLLGFSALAAQAQSFPSKPGWETGPWFGIFVRSGTPEPVLRKLHGESVRALGAPGIRDKLVAQGANVIGNTPEEFAAFIRAESARWGRLVRQAGIRAD